VLVEALAGLKKRNWQLKIVGAARSLETVKALQAEIDREGLSDRIQLLGAVRDRDLDDFYEKADLFVMSSLFEGYGMVLAEALQRGLPIITTTGGAASQTVPEGAASKCRPAMPMPSARRSTARWPIRACAPRLAKRLSSPARSFRPGKTLPASSPARWLPSR
jgi:glycosyltransferase involved in cell wall biosynthesis